MAQFAIDEILTTGIAISGFVFDVSNNIGANGYVLTSTSSGVMWQQDSSNADLSSLSGQIAATGTLLNNRINSLSGYAGNTFLSGSGTQYYVPRWNTARELVTGSIYDLGTGIGIGTTSPAAKLEVKGADDAVITAIFQSFAGNPAYNGGIQLGNAVANQNSQIYHSSAGDNTLTFVSNYSQGTANKFIFAPGGTETVRFQQNGRVGIGTASPTTLLSVGGAGSTSAASGLTFGGDSVVNLYRLSDSVLKTDAAFTAASLSSSSYVYAATYLQTAGGQLYAGAPYGTLTVYVGNTAQNAWEAGLYVGRGSYVGIGTTQPSGKLHVVSTVAGETVLRADGTNGTLFSVTDDLSDSLMSVNNSAGLPVFEVFADDRVVAGQYGSGDFVLVNNKVGIGTTNPTYKLHVLGDTLISGNLTNPTIIGLSGALNITGSTLDTKINTLSGYSNANFATITNLAATGSTLDTKINTTNTNLAATGSTLDARINSLSGYANNTFISGVGVANYVARWSNTKELLTGSIYDLGTGIGIGTTSPAAKFNVYGGNTVFRNDVVGGTSAVFIRNWASSPSTSLTFGNNPNDDSSTTLDLTDNVFSITNYGDPGSSIKFGTRNDSTADIRVTIDPSGRVGIGATNLSSLLTVGGAGSTNSFSGISFGQDSQANLYRISSSRIKTDGNFTIDGQGGGATSLVLNRSSTSSENGMAFNTAGSVDWYFFINDGGTDLQIQRSSEIDSAPRVRFDGANSNVLFNLGGGNVGIGTPSPNTKLRISGSFSQRASGSPPIQEYKNILTYNSDNYSTGAYVVRTPFQIGNSYEMPIVHVKGYGYGDAKLYDFKVVFYDYGPSHSPISYSLIDLGNDGSPKYLAKDASNYINVCFGQTGDVHYYYRFTVDCITTRQENDYSQGWGMYQTKVANFGFASTGIYALSSPVNFNVANNFVGIGKTNPSAKLDVVGNIYLSADIVGNDGTRGYLLGKDSLSAGRCYLILDPDAADGVGVGSDYLYIAQENTTGVISNTTAGPLLLNPGAGSVGIGTTNAVAQFHIGGTASNSDPWMVLDVNDTFFKRIVFSEERPANGTTAYGGYIGYDASANTVSLGTYENSVEKRSINILRDNGYVGIGTTQPLNRLSVISSNSTNYYNTNAPVAVFQGVSPSTVLIAVDGNVDGYYSELKLGNAEGTYYPYSAYIRGIQGAGIDYYRMEFGTSNGSAAATRMTIANNGNIGIGITNPSNKLHISGGGISFTTSTGLAVPMIGIVLPTNIAYIGPYATTTDGNAPSTVAFNHGTSVQQTWFYSSGRIAMVLNKEGRLNIAGNAGNTPPALLNVGPASSVDAVSGMSFGNDSSANLYRSAAGALKTDGSLGIGINPVQKLQVDGAVGNPALNGTTQSGIFRISNTTDNAVLDFGIRAGGLGAWIQSTDETSLSATYPLLLNPNGGSVGIGITNPSGQLHLRNMGFTNQDTVPDTNLFPNASGVFGLVMDHDTYTNGLYRHRFIKVDRSANIPLYLQQAGSVAHQYINLVRFGTHSQSTDTFEVFGDSRINGSVNVTSTLSTSGSINIGTDLYVSGQLGVGVPIANKRLNYGAEIKANNFSIQLVLGRIGAVSGLGAIGADANNTFAVWNVSGQTTRQFVVTQQGNVGIGSASPVSRLDVNGTIALSGYSFADRFAVYNRVWNPELPSIYLGDSSDPTNYYDNTTHIFRARGAGAERMRITTAGNVGIGSESPTQKLDVSGTLKIKSAGTYSDPTDNAGFLNYDTVGGIFTLSARSDGGNTYMAFRTSNGGTGSEKVRITNDGNVGINQTSPAYKLDVNGASRFANDILSNGNITIAKAGAYLYINGTNSDAEIYWQANGTPRWAMGMNVGDATENLNIYNYTTATTNFTILKANGNVGIGTASPVTKLDVVGPVGSFPTGAGTITTGVNLRLRNSDSDLVLDIGGNGGNGNWLQSTSRSDLSLTYPLLLNPNGGNVGIGTTSPNSILDVYKVPATSGTLQPMLTLTSDFATAASINFGSSIVFRGKTAGNVLQDNAQISAYNEDMGDNGYALAFFTRPTVAGGLTQRMTVLRGGNVGIGTTSPAYLLDVRGTTVETVAQFRGTNDTTIVIGGNDVGRNGEQYITYRNADTAGNAWMVGLDDAEDFRFAYGTAGEISNDNTKVKIGQDGKVGIGLTSPQKQLDVISSENDFVTVGARTLSIGGWAGVHFGYREDNNFYRKSAIVFERTDLTQGNSQGKVHILNGPIAGGGNATLSDAKITIDESGNIGIGTTVPTGRLHIVGSNDKDNGPIIRLAGSTINQFEGGRIRFNESVGTYYQGAYIHYDASNNIFNLGVHGNIDSLTSSDVNAISILRSNAYVGIGTTNPIYNLDVVGPATSNGVTLRLNDVASVADSRHILLTRASAQASIGVAGSQTNDPLWISRSSGYDLIIDLNGRVGLGIISPATLLGVGGAGSTTAASGITFGADAQANLYRSAEDTLRTDGALIAGSYLRALSYVQFLTNLYPDSYGDNVNINIGNTAGNSWETAIKIKPGSYVGIGTTQPSGKLHIVSNVAGETVLRADGTNGTLFSVVDDLSDSLMSVNNSAGLPVFEVFADDRVVAGQYGSGDFVLVNNKVGIGTSNPSYRLDVRGSGVNSRVGLMEFGTWPLETTYIYLQNNSLSLISANYGFLQSPAGEVFVNAAAGQTLHFRIGNVEKWAVTSAGILQSDGAQTIRTSTGPLTLATNAGDGHIILSPNGAGNVGIGTASPNAKLQIAGTTASLLTVGTLTNDWGGVVAIGTPNGNGIILSKVNTTNDTNRVLTLMRDDTNGASIFGYTPVGTSTSIGFQIRASASSYFNGGNVGIGQTSPLEKLQVQGNIYATDGALFNFKAQRIPIEGNPQGGTYKGYLILAKAYTSGFLEASYVIGKVILRRGTSGTGHNVDIYEVNSSRGYNTEIFQVSRLGAIGTRFVRLVKVTYGGVVYHAIETSDSGGQPSTEMYFEGSIIDSPLILTDASFVSNVTAFGNGVIFVDQSSNIGIGTVSPTTLLSVGPVGSTLPASGLTFGGDAEANLYRSAEDTIKTDGNLIVVGNVTAANLVSGNGTANYITKWNGTKSIANSQIFDDGTYVGVNTAVNTTYRLQVNGSFAATTKSFDITHPTISGKRLVYASLEGPENGVYFRGKNDNNEINLPHYWSGLVHDDSITVNLTSIGKRKDGRIRNYSVDQIGHNKVYIYTDSDDNIYDYYYTIFAERKDVSKLVIERDME